MRVPKHNFNVKFKGKYFYNLNIYYIHTIILSISAIKSNQFFFKL